jgi:CheY-like chemotaxis protein
MGGTLSVATEIGKGSTFRFNVALPQVSECLAESPKSSPNFRGHRVAIIDRTTNRFSLRETLGGWGIETAEFTSSDEALAGLMGMPLGQPPYSCVIVDGGRPPADGFETAAQIRSIFPNLRVVMLASDDRPGDEVRCRESGFSGYAVRPISPAGLLQLVSHALEAPAATPPPVRQPALGVAALAPGRSLRVLVAEDSPDNRLLIHFYLQGSLHSLTFVEHGGEAVERAASGEFDVVLMDLQMPVMDGLTATRAIRAMEREKGGRAVPVLALSANARPEDIESSLAAGCNAHLSKPISKKRLLAALDEYTQAPLAGTSL